jgi:hypothetical protein
VKKCLEQDKRDINEEGVAPQRWRPLHCAAVCGRIQVAQYLLEHGAAPSVQVQYKKSLETTRLSKISSRAFSKASCLSVLCVISC